MPKPCEYCGADLPNGIDRRTRRLRSAHFATCEARLKLSPMSLDNRLIAYSAAEKLRELGYEWDGEGWVPVAC